MQKALALFTAHLRVCVAEDEAHRREEVTLSGSIAADDDVGLGGERLNDRLVLVAISGSVSTQAPSHSKWRGCDAAPFEALDDDLLDIHGRQRGRRCATSERPESCRLDCFVPQVAQAQKRGQKF